jgi:hypothetical protein
MKRKPAPNLIKDWTALLRALAAVITATTALLIVAERLLG